MSSSRFRFGLMILSCLPLMVAACGPIEPLPPDTHLETPEPPILAAPQMQNSANQGAPVASWGNPDETAHSEPSTSVVAPIIHQPVAAGPEPIAAVPVQPVETMELRVARLEGEVGALRREMQLILPELRQLIAQKQAQAAVVKPQAVVAQAKLKPSVHAPVSQGVAKLTGIRAGEHPGKTRLVMDTGSKTPFHYDLDNTEKVLIIELPEASSAGTPLSATLSKSPFVQSYALQATDKGSRVVIQLKQPVKVAASEIGATNGVGHRIVFDLSSL